MNIQNEHDRAILFLDRKIIVHVITLDEIFHNGLLLEVADDFFIIKDRVDGKEPVIFFNELKKSIEKYTEVGS